MTLTISIPKEGVELKSIDGIQTRVALEVGEQMRTPGLVGAAHSAAAMAGRSSEKIAVMANRNNKREADICPPQRTQKCLGSHRTVTPGFRNVGEQYCGYTQPSQTSLRK